MGTSLLKDMKRKFKRLAKAIKNAWSTPKAKRPKSAGGEWKKQKGEDEGIVELPNQHSCDGSVGISLSNTTNP